MLLIQFHVTLPGCPLSAVPAALPLDEGRVEPHAAVHDLLHAEPLTVVHRPPEPATV